MSDDEEMELRDGDLEEWIAALADIIEATIHCSGKAPMATTYAQLTALDIVRKRIKDAFDRRAIRESAQ